MEISKEHLGLALLTVLCVLVVKGFYLDLWDEVVFLRHEMATLHEAEQGDPHARRQLDLLRTRLKRARVLAEKLEARKGTMSPSALPLFLNEQAEQAGVKPVGLFRDEDQVEAWRMEVDGQTEALTQFLYALETSGKPVSIAYIEMTSGEPVRLSLVAVVEP